MHVTSRKAAELHQVILVCMMSFTLVVVYTNIFFMLNVLGYVKELDFILEKPSKNYQSHFNFH